MSPFDPVQWTPDMDAALKALRARKVGVVQCAKAVGVSDGVVKKRLAVLGLPRLPVGNPGNEARR